MKLFIDTVNIKEINKANEMSVLDSVTTNLTPGSREIGKKFLNLTYSCSRINQN